MVSETNSMLTTRGDDDDEDIGRWISWLDGPHDRTPSNRNEVFTNPVEETTFDSIFGVLFEYSVFKDTFFDDGGISEV